MNRHEAFSQDQRTMRIYTKQGDVGETRLPGGGRVSKDHPRIEAYGTVDELNALLGLAAAEAPGAALEAVLGRVQEELFVVGAELAAPDATVLSRPRIGPPHVAALEADIDRFDTQLPPLKSFILPAGTRAAAALHMARTVCRRAERRVVTLNGTEPAATSGHVLAYLNRLSDLLFVLARAANAQAGRPEHLWSNP